MYDELYETWKTEKENVEPQRFQEDFYTKIVNYVKRIREERRMLDEKTTKAKLFKREFENVNYMVKELFQLRYKKSCEKALARETVPRKVLTQQEEKFHRELLPLAEAYQKFLKNILQGRLSRIEKEGKLKKILLRFIQEVPAIVGSDMKTYGPFETEDIATLPSENARILIKKGAAVEMEVK